MSVSDVERAIKSVQKHVFAFQPNPPHGAVNPAAPANNHETSTRYIIIDPVLRALGWDLADPDDCVVECVLSRRSGGLATRVDYVLKDSRGRPAIAIEAKRIDVMPDDDDSTQQMDRYLQHLPSVNVAVVTNGQYWLIAKRDGNGWQAESRYPLGLHFGRTNENARRLWDSLSKQKLAQVQAPRRTNFRSAAGQRNQYGRRR